MSARLAHALLVAAWVAGGLLCAGCRREERVFRVLPPVAARTGELQVSELQPGGRREPAHRENEYEKNAVALTEGKRLFQAFNCVGCHANGGGSIGPALLDEKWRYGSAPEQVFASIMEGRPNGMPAFHGKISEHQVWEIAAYVRSMSGLVPKDAAPARDDHMKTSPPPNSVDPVRRAIGEPPPNPQ